MYYARSYPLKTRQDNSRWTRPVGASAFMHALLEMPVKREREETEGREEKGRKE